LERHRKLYLVRHGESTGNLSGAFLGLTDCPLTEKGLRQAKALGLFFSTKTLARLFTSPLIRAKSTADAIGQQIGLSPIVAPEWIEQDFGHWDGIAVETIRKHQSVDFEQWRQADIQTAPPGGESLSSVAHRIQSWLNAFRNDFDQKPGDVAIIAHGGVIQTALCLLLHTPMRNQWPYLPAAGSVTTLVFNDDQVALTHLGLPSHLPD